MGMNVKGKAASAEVGKYFRNNVWWWHPLWDYCQHIAPDLTVKVKYGHSNNGDGLGTNDSKSMAFMLRAAIKSAECAVYAKAYKQRMAEQRMAELPKEKCKTCDGTGVRPDGKEQFSEEWFKETNGCNGCKGKRWNDASDASYPFSVVNVEEFADFLEHCGGFEIY